MEAYKKRNTYCAEITEKDIGKEIILNAWVQKQRDLGSLVFVWLRDKSGIIQVVFDQNTCSEDTFQNARKLRSEYVVSVSGNVRKRDESAVNENLKTGTIEIIGNELVIINESNTPPIYIDDNSDESESIRLKYRYLDIRRAKIRDALIFRHQTIRAIREYVDNHGFTEIETPMLTKSTPEGARDYLVPSRVHPGEFYALPQSPQIYKQLLMLGGMDRYYQLARCFRDEDGRADRQPEFTQFDMEMSFVDQIDIQNIVEGIYKNVFKKVKGIELNLPLPRITWKEAMYKYGSDKPDTRFDMQIHTLNDILKDSGFSVFDKVINEKGIISAILLKNGADLSRKHIDRLQELVRTYHVSGLAWIKIQEDGEIKSSLSKVLDENKIKEILNKLEAQNGDICFIIADKEYVSLTAMGQLRLNLAKERNLIDTSKYNLLWVTEFPLFEWSEEENRLVAMHHPFTSPMLEDAPLMDTNPAEVRANAYDLVMNGVEMGSGSIRIHKSELQSKMFKLLGFTEDEANDKFGFLIEAFKYGTPPHGGFAFGIDRLVMVLLGAESLRDVLAFPKIQNGKCLMMDTPTPVSDEQLHALKLTIDK